MKHNFSECSLTLPDGTTFVGSSDDGFVEFKGIPYAQPPTGVNRWKPPQLITTYDGAEIDATQQVKCATNSHREGETEDCLVVNISAKQTTIASGEKVPIVYYIHGGGFNSGANAVRQGRKDLIADLKFNKIEIYILN